MSPLFSLIAGDLRAKAAWSYERTDARALLKTLAADGTAAMVLYRFMQWAGSNRLWPLEFVFGKANAVLNNCIIGRGAQFGPRFVLIHATGVVINGSVRGGAGVHLEHQVTIGAERRRSPILGDHVFVGAGAKILGEVRVGDYARVGANAVVIKDVPAGATVVGVPGRVVRRRDGGPAAARLPSAANGSDREPERSNLPSLTVDV